MMTNIKNVTVKFFSTCFTIISLLFAEVSAFCVTRFDNLGPGMLSLLSREKTREEKKKILSYTVKNLIVFGLASIAINQVLGLSTVQKLIINCFFAVIGLSVFIFVTATEKKFQFSNLTSCVNITLRIGFIIKIVMVGVSLIANIPIVGPLFLGLFVVINLPKVLKEELKRFL